MYLVLQENFDITSHQLRRNSSVLQKSRKHQTHPTSATICLLPSISPPSLCIQINREQHLAPLMDAKRQQQSILHIKKVERARRRHRITRVNVFITFYFIVSNINVQRAGTGAPGTQMRGMRESSRGNVRAAFRNLCFE